MSTPPAQFILNPAACSDCNGTSHRVTMLSQPGTTPDGAVGITIAFKVEHCPKCRGTGLSNPPAVVLDPNLR